VNCGGGAYLNEQSFVYAADSGFEGGEIVTSTASIANTPDEALYRTARAGDFSYTAHLAPGRTYTVALHFAETEVKKTRKRMFNISLNGKDVWTRFDILARAPRNTAKIVPFRRVWPDQDGRIRIRFSTVKRGALCSAISIY
jgi:hypothetical protein